MSNTKNMQIFVVWRC